MKRSRRILSILCCLVMLFSVLGVSAMADMTEFFTASYSISEYYGDESYIRFDVALSTIWPEQDLAQDIADYAPCLVVWRDGVEVGRYYFQAPIKGSSESVLSVTFTEAGTYDAEIFNNWGLNDGLYYDEESGWYYPQRCSEIYFDPAESGYSGDYYYTLQELLDSDFYYFLGDVKLSGRKATVTVSGLRGETGSALSSLISSQSLLVYALTYNSATGEYNEVEKTISPSAVSGSKATVTLDLPEYTAVMIDIYGASSSDSYDLCAAMKTEEEGLYDIFNFSQGEFPEYEPISFDDVSDEAWYYQYVTDAAELGLISGYDDNTFHPDANMSYAEAITLAARIHYLLNNDFDDPAGYFTIAGASPWYKPYVDYARANGIPCDYSDYGAAATREEYVHIFYAALPAEYREAINSIPSGSIPDVPANGRYASEIYAFYRCGILTGNDERGTFTPKSNILRCQVATIICRMVETDYRASFSLG